MIINWNKAENKTITDQDLITEFSDSQFDAIHAQLFKVFRFKGLWCESKKRNYFMNCPANLDDFFGLAYTSSSDFASLWNTNAQYAPLPGQYLKCFAISKENQVIAITSDYNENYRYFNLGQLN